MEYCSLRVDDFNLKRLLLVERRAIVRLCVLGERVGYLETGGAANHWVWLTKDQLLSIRCYNGQELPIGAGAAPEFALNAALGNEAVFKRRAVEASTGD
jgi:hypothetical protein